MSSVAPVDLGTGTPNKVFEAFEAGAAVVASAGVIARASSSGARAPARAAATDEEFAREITAYLTDPERAARDGAACRAFAEAHADRRASVAAFAAAYRAARGGRVRPRGERPGRGWLLAAGDVSVAVGLFALIVAARRLLPLPGTLGKLPASNLSLEFPWLALVGFVAVAALWLAGTYDEPLASVKERGGLLVSALVAGGLLLAAYFFAGRAVPRTVLLIYVPLLSFALGLWRSFAEVLAPIGTRAVLVLGSGEDARRAAEALRTGQITGHSLAGWSESASLEELKGAEDVIFASDRPEDRPRLVALLERSLESDFDLWILPGLADIVSSRAVTRSLADLPLTPVATRGASILAFAWRRALDLVVGAVLLVAALPDPPPRHARGRARQRGRSLDPPAPGRPRRPRVPLVEGAHDAGRRGSPDGAHAVRPRRRTGDAHRRVSEADAAGRAAAASARGGRLDEPHRAAAGTPGIRGDVREGDPRLSPAPRAQAGPHGPRAGHGSYATKPDVKLRYDLGYLFHWTPFLDVFILLRTIVTVLKGSGI